ncbi:MAG: hypothetical protein J1F42_07420 [Lachnospiraceae bacterium]|nr:hypothetical protein [Lachnospiraceae bacterium]
MSIAMVVGICMPVQAASASASGTINGVPCYATLTVDDKVTATTFSSLAAYHYVSLTCTFYYTDENGRVQSDTVTAQASDSHTVTATAHAHGNNVQNILATSHHTVTYNGYSWNADLRIP